ncbi:MAG: glycosyltransferase [Lachnospiraceae bacterium]|nr:glycosyltransferase [Lachnospiraceae bacterium]
MFNIKALLEQHGHEVYPFSVHSDKNEPTQYDRFFVEPIGGRSAVYYDDYKKTPATIIKMISRSVYSPEVKRALEREIRELKPDVVYILQCVNKLSPSVIRAARKMGVPVVMRLSDYNLLCPKFDFLRGTSACEDCVKIGYRCCIKHRCVKGSFFASVVRVCAMKFHKMIHIYDDVDAFVTPSRFLQTKLIENGFKPERVHHIPTFTVRQTTEADGDDMTAGRNAGDYGLYFGRLTAQKDIITLIRAYERLSDHKLMIVGDDTIDEGPALKQYVEDHNISNVEFAGFKSGKDLEDIIRGSRFTIIPSMSYENMPNSALESFLYYKPLIAADIGSLSELVDDSVNGYLYEPRNVDELTDKILLMDDDDAVIRMGIEAHKPVSDRYSPEKHYEALMGIFDALI